ncbi:hypothetical protein GQ43DRAFT_363558 [Delitschia confertaspora ATCC 74209]|uniref:Glycosyltransferase family 34 protein n=1 Tax=Delitschia confertaspora ATCC 74209 TaxID=1513339 RepID=A0A9P4JSS8_9PLEO|nr:hypothetical protein GQ43DRAFT_363558 [Delitschia confertaspora ATCC 74209]
MDTQGLYVVKASMLYGERNDIYERAMESHSRGGCDVRVLRKSITTGFWNKFLWLQMVIIEELRKQKEERADWIMWTDASTILLNPLIPLSTFLPPPNEAVFDSVLLIATKPATHLSTAAFFIRVSPASLALLTKTMAAPMYADKGKDWGNAIDESALQVVLSEDEYKDMVVYQPSPWYNSAVRSDGSFEGEVEDGVVMARFPSSLNGDRWQLMDDLLNEIQADPKKFRKGVEETMYPAKAKEFWERLKRAKEVLKEAGDKRDGDGLEEFEKQVERLKQAVYEWTWDGKAVGEAVERVEGMMHSL